MRKLAFLAFVVAFGALYSAAASAEDAMPAPGEQFAYGGPADPLGTGDPIPGVTDTLSPGAASVYTTGSGPINLRPGGYIQHQYQMQEPAATPTTPATDVNPNSAAAHNASLVKAKQQQQQNAVGAPMFPGGWPVYNGQ